MVDGQKYISSMAELVKVLACKAKDLGANPSGALLGVSPSGYGTGLLIQNNVGSIPITPFYGDML